MKKFALFVLVALVIALMPFAAQAQAPLKLAEMEVDLWPEYDQPTMLVIYHITLPAATTFPTPMSIRIPAAAGKPNAVATLGPNGDLISINYDQQTSGEWSTLTFDATTPNVQVEYYDPSLVKDGQKRSYTYTWPGDYAVDTFKVQVQQPIGATDMSISSGMGEAQTDPNGLVYYNRTIGAVPAEQELTIDISYNKPNDDLSASSVPVEPSGPIQPSTGSGFNAAAALPWLLGGLGLLLIVGGGIWYWRSGRSQSGPQRSSRKRRRSTERSSAPGGGEGGEHIYCHNCGKRAGSGDRFCRTCGSALRTN